jgi:hypothetical protein
MGQFDDYPSPIEAMNSYMYHCHILTHEDSIGGMMGLYAGTGEGTLHVKGSSTEPSTPSLIDLRGRRVRAEELPAFDSETVIDTRGLPFGVYLVEWRTSQGVVTGKVMLK